MQSLAFWTLEVCSPSKAYQHTAGPAAPPVRLQNLHVQPRCWCCLKRCLRAASSRRSRTGQLPQRRLSPRPALRLWCLPGCWPGHGSTGSAWRSSALMAASVLTPSQTTTSEGCTLALLTNGPADTASSVAPPSMSALTMPYPAAALDAGVSGGTGASTSSAARNTAGVAGGDVRCTAWSVSHALVAPWLPATGACS